MSARNTTQTTRIVRRLLAERGIARYALFLTQQEGRQLPGGIEAISGFVLSETGEVHGFWLDWDAEGERYVLDPWYRVADLTEFEDSPEYRRALRRMEMGR